MPRLHKDTIGEVVAIVAVAVAVGVVVVAGRNVVAADDDCVADLCCNVHYGRYRVAPISSYRRLLGERVLCLMRRDLCNSYVCVCCR